MTVRTCQSCTSGGIYGGNLTDMSIKMFWQHLWWQIGRDVNQRHSGGIYGGNLTDMSIKHLLENFPKFFSKSDSSELVKASEKKEFTYIANHLIIF